MNRSLLIICLCYCGVCSAQKDEFTNFYPADSLYKMQKVKSATDTTSMAGRAHYKIDYDTLGRRTAWYYIESDSVKTVYQYITVGDTLMRVERMNKNGKDTKAYLYEKFLYNKAGKIAHYQYCKTNHDNKTSDCRVENFFYDDDGVLTSTVGYLNRHYPQSFSEGLMINEALLTIANVYSYEYDKIKRLTIRKEKSGIPSYRSVDSIFHDEQYRVTKTVSFQQNGFLGELIAYNIRHVTMVAYGVNKKTVLSFTTSGGLPNEEPTTTRKSEEEYIYYDNGLQQKWYLSFEDEKKSLLSYTVYTFY